MSNTETTYMDRCINNMMAHIRADNNIMDYVIKGPNGDQGFMWDKSPHLDKLSNLTDADGHSGASFACCVRACQARLRQEQLDQANGDFPE